MHFAYLFAAVFAAVGTFFWILPFPYRQGDVDGLTLGIWSVTALTVSAGFWLLAIHDSQLHPHVITTSINGRTVSQFVADNPEFVSWTTVPQVTTNGLEYRSVPHTNYYWHVWTIFRK